MQKIKIPESAIPEPLSNIGANKKGRRCKGGWEGQKFVRREKLMERINGKVFPKCAVKMHKAGLGGKGRE